eukprot:1357365-Prymnesium_polylepis.1
MLHQELHQKQDVLVRHVARGVVQRDDVDAPGEPLDTAIRREVIDDPEVGDVSHMSAVVANPDGEQVALVVSDCGHRTQPLDTRRPILVAAVQALDPVRVRLLGQRRLLRVAMSALSCAALHLRSVPLRSISHRCRISDRSLRLWGRLLQHGWPRSSRLDCRPRPAHAPPHERPYLAL